MEKKRSLRKKSHKKSHKKVHKGGMVDGRNYFAYAKQFEFPLSPCYKNTFRAGIHAGGKKKSKKASLKRKSPKRK